MDDQLRFDEEPPRNASDQPPPSEDLLLAVEVARLLRVNPAWVYAETRANRLPHVRLGRSCRYRRSAIDAWLIEQEREMRKRPRG